MFLVTDTEAEAIRAIYEQGGELSAAIELRRLFPGITDNAKARAHVRTIAGWSPLPPKQEKVVRLPSRGCREHSRARHSPGLWAVILARAVGELEDTRQDYGEIRLQAFAEIEGKWFPMRLHAPQRCAAYHHGAPH